MSAATSNRRPNILIVNVPDGYFSITPGRMDNMDSMDRNGQEWTQGDTESIPVHQVHIVHLARR